MQRTNSLTVSRWRRFWEGPDPRLLEAGARIERAIARVRLVALALLGVIPAAATLRSGQMHDAAGLIIVAIALVCAAFAFRMTKAQRPWPRLGLALGMLDVTMVSAALSLYLVLNRPDMALNARITFPIYFLVIAASALRYDVRICVIVGGLAVLEYAAIVFASVSLRDVHAAAFEVGGYGRFEWTSQVNRVLLLTIATLLAVAVVQRTEFLLGEVQGAEQRLAELSRRLIAAQEDERQQLARELHDEMGQAMTALKLGLLALTRVDADQGRTQVAQCLEIVNDTMSRAREMALALRPSLLDDLGLESAIRWHADRLAPGAGFTVRVASTGQPASLSPDRKTACFRVAQEALTNAAKHAGAKHIDIELAMTEANFRLTIRDDGKGFDVAEGARHASTRHSMGLLGMRERVRLLGGEFRITSEPGAGTLVAVSLPNRPAGVSAPLRSPA
jgi:signal transduction histidine kinase